jgi:hypothetical protein
VPEDGTAHEKRHAFLLFLGGLPSFFYETGFELGLLLRSGLISFPIK